MLTVGSLFSGIGGIDLGLERAGMSVKWHSEIDPYASKVLKKHWPTVPNLGDITTINWEEVEKVDVIAGGYPCQPFSNAGQRQGENDERHLWPYFRDAISGLRPQYAILENVRGHLSLGFDRVLGDLADIGYDAEWQLVSAASVGAPHQRNRLFVIAYPSSARLEGSIGQIKRERETAVSPVGTWWDTESGVRRVADGIPKRMDRLKCLGNAVVPQVAEYIGRMIMDFENG